MDRFPCKWCSKPFLVKSGGLERHQNACPKSPHRQQERAEQARQMYAGLGLNRLDLEPNPSGPVSDANIPNLFQHVSDSSLVEDVLMEEDAHAGMNLDDSESLGDVQGGAGDYIENGPSQSQSYIRVRYHPRTGLPDRIIPIGESTAHSDVDDDHMPQKDPTQDGLPPWAPFPSLSDFLFASHMIRSCKSKTDINFILHGLQNGVLCQPGAGKLSFKTADALFSLVEKTAALYPQFKDKSFEHTYIASDGTKSTVVWPLYVKDGMQMTREMVKDPGLKDKWIWYAEQRSMVMEGVDMGGYVTHPLTAQSAWETEATLPAGTDYVQFPFALYADKSNAARFSNIVIYPVLAEPLGLEKDGSNRNSEFAGNNCIAMLPKIQPPDGDKKNPYWPTLAREILHTALKITLEPFKKPNRDGEAIECADGVTRKIVPTFPLVRTDYEEQAHWAATYSANSLHPGTSCEVHRDDLSDLAKPCVLRTHAKGKEILRAASRASKDGDRKKLQRILKDAGLYGIPNAFWEFARMDIHRSLCFCELHTIWLGLMGAHTWPLIREVLDSSEATLFERRVSKLKKAPSYAGMIHFEDVNKTDYNDGKHFFSLFQQILPYIHDLLPAQYLPFLRLIRLLVEIAMRAQLRLQFESRISRGEELVQEFGRQLKIVQAQNLFPDKNFNFPKLHQLAHLFSDIRRKGTTDYLGTITGENFHQGLIDAYEASNKKNATAQICRQEDRNLVISRVQWRIRLSTQDTDDIENAGDDEPEAVDSVEKEQTVDTPSRSSVGPDGFSLPPLAAWHRGKLKGLAAKQRYGAHLVKLKYASSPVSITGIVRKAFGTDSIKIQEQRGFYLFGIPAFDNFHRSLNIAINLISDELGSQRTEDGDSAALPIYAYHRMTHSIISKDTFYPQQLHIICTNSFHSRQRFDTVLVKSFDGIVPARLHLIFETFRHGMVWQMALITPFTRLPTTTVDRALGMRRYTEEKEGQFIMLNSIERSCYMSPTTNDELYLNDTMGGGDLFLRVAEMSN